MFRQSNVLSDANMPERLRMPKNDYVMGNQLGIINIELTLFNASCQQLPK